MAPTTPSFHIVVFPMPGSPERRSAAGPAGIESRNCHRGTSSESRPMMISAKSALPGRRTAGFYVRAAWPLREESPLLPVARGEFVAGSGVLDDASQESAHTEGYARKHVLTRLAPNLGSDRVYPRSSG